MGDFGTLTNPAHYVEIADPLNLGQVLRPSAGLVIKARAHTSGTALADITTVDYGYWSATYAGVDLIDVSGDGGTTWVGPLVSRQGTESSTTSGAVATQASLDAASALATAQDALTTAQNGPAATWDNITGKPTAFPPTAHTHPTSQLTVAPVIKTFLDGVDAQTARAAIGAGTGNGTSNLTLGTTATTAAPGNHAHAASAVAFTPTGSLTATDVQTAIVQASQSGGTVTGNGTTLDVLYASGAYPTQAATPPTGIKVRHFYGPVQYQGASWTGVLDLYTYAALT